MPLQDNMYYYIAYGLILVTFVIVLRSPKKDKSKKHKDDNSEEK